MIPETTRKPKHTIPMLIFSSIIFFICLGDGIMSYLTPVFVESVLKNSFLFGIVISSASFFGMIFDFFAAKNFINKNYKFFVTGMIVFALIFPVILMVVTPNIATFLGAMLVWSLYYEFRDFSKFNFVHSAVDKVEHVKAWSLLELFQAGAYLLGPAIAIVALEKLGSDRIPFYIAILAYAPSVIFFFILNATFKHRIYSDIETPRHNRSIIKEIGVLRVLGKKIWPIFLFTATIQTVDAAFWSVGVLLSEQFRHVNSVGGLFMVLYGVAGVVMGAIAGKVFKPTGKKHMAFLIGIIAGITAILIGVTQNIYLILGEVIVISASYTVSVILISAVFEDYVARLGDFSNDMVGISLITNNVAYLSGPIILGAIAQTVGLQRTYIYLGIYVIAISLLALAIVPRKVRLPQKELAIEFK